MCTSVSLKTKNDIAILARTLDLSSNFDQAIRLTPKNYLWENVVTGEKLSTTYAILGMGTVMNAHPMYADGMNEKGLCCAGLNFLGFAKYEGKAVNGKDNIAPHDVPLWALSQFQNLDELKDALESLCIVNKPFPPLKFCPTLHWIFSDISGKSIVVEQTVDGLHVFDNPIGVMTNNPDFSWHLTNLTQYIRVKSKQPLSTEWGDMILSPFSEGFGGIGLPGDFSSTARFIRAAFLRNNFPEVNNEVEAITETFHLFSNLEMPRGAVVTISGDNYTSVYTSAMCSSSLTYYYCTYQNRQIVAINMRNEDLYAEHIKSFPYRNNQAIQFEN